MSEKDYSKINRSRGGNVRGVPQREINKKRGELGHQKANSITASMIQEQYASVGIDLTREEATEVRLAMVHYTSIYGDFMREVYIADKHGEKLTSREQELLKEYKLVEEYCKVAPTFKYKAAEGQTEIYRGIQSKNTPSQQEYFNGLLALKPGAVWDNDHRPTSYSTSLSSAGNFASRGGIIVHAPAKKLKNSISVKGISRMPQEDEVLVSDYKWKVARVSDQRNTPDGHYHIYLK